jgi:hypothetical protein
LQASAALYQRRTNPGPNTEKIITGLLCVGGGRFSNRALLTMRHLAILAGAAASIFCIRLLADHCSFRNNVLQWRSDGG